jgi:hypothetical protein
MTTPRIQVIGVYSPTVDMARYQAFVNEQVARQNPINFSDELKAFLRRVGREAEIVALSPEELEERREYFEQEFAGVAQVEVLVEYADAHFSVADFKQVNPAVPESRWQVAWNEQFLTADGLQLLGEYRLNELPTETRYRIAFFIHSWNHSLGLTSTYGPLSLVPITAIPERLWQLAPFELVD